MHGSQYKKMAEHPLRHVVRSMIQDRRDLPTRAELRENIDAALLPTADVKTREAVFDKAIDFAERAAKDRGSWFDLRGEADYYVLSLLEDWEAAERILPIEEEEIDSGGIADEVLKQAALTEGPRLRPAVGHEINRKLYPGNAS
jgi:hypothetical protein